MCSSGLEALSCPFSTKFLRSTDLRFTTSPAIATYTLLPPSASFSSSVCLSVVRLGRHILCQVLACVSWCDLAMCGMKGSDHSYVFAFSLPPLPNSIIFGSPMFISPFPESNFFISASA